MLQTATENCLNVLNCHLKNVMMPKKNIIAVAIFFFFFKGFSWHNSLNLTTY